MNNIEILEKLISFNTIEDKDSYNETIKVYKKIINHYGK